MKIINAKLSTLMLVFLLLNSCKKGSTSSLPASKAKCKPTTESTTLSGNAATYEYTYSADGNIFLVKKFIGGTSNLLQDSTVVYYDHIETYSPGRIIGQFNKLYSAFDANIFTGHPTKAAVSITLDGIEQHNYWSYFFFYDSKGRLIKIEEHTNTVAGDYEYNLNVAYNDQDNVTALSYELTTGPRTVSVIPVSGYDDKPNPFVSIKNWQLIMHAAWNYYDPEPVLTALSKNNPLGYTSGAWTRIMSYTYNDKGFPLTRTNTNTTSSGSATFLETFNFKCE